MRMEAYPHTLESLTGDHIVLADLVHELHSLRRLDVFRWIAGLSAVISRRNGMELQNQRQMASQLLKAEYWSKLEPALFQREKGEPGGVLFHRRGLLFVLQIALLACNDDAEPLAEDELRHVFARACLMANDLLKQVEMVQTPEIPETDQEHWLITILISFIEPYLGHEVIGRAKLLWLTIPSEDRIKAMAKTLGIASFDEIMRNNYGITLSEFFVFGLLLYFHYLQPAVQPQPSALVFDRAVITSLFEQSDLDAAFKLLACTPDEMAVRLLGTPRQSWSTDYAPMLGTPLLEVEKGKFVCPDLQMYRDVFVHGIHSLFSKAIGRPFKQLFGYIFERFVEIILGQFTVSEGPLARTFYCRVVFVNSKHEQVCDGLLHWTSLAVLMEYKAGSLTSRQRFALRQAETMQAVDDLLARLGEGRKGIGQLANSMRRITNGEPIRCGPDHIDLSSCRVMYPALVLYDEALGNHAIREYLSSKLTAELEKTNTSRERIGRLLIFTIRELELFEELAQTMGAENLMRDYVAYVENNPSSPYSAFNAFALGPCKHKLNNDGFIQKAEIAVLREIEQEIQRRKLPGDVGAASC
ncbi:MAG TPA: hypothetical protein VGG64_21995 [Pirellulales bacterium]